MAKTDRKANDDETQFVKEEGESTRNYIFQTSSITKVAVIIVVVFLVLIIIGLIVSGTEFFEGF